MVVKLYNHLGQAVVLAGDGPPRTATDNVKKSCFVAPRREFRQCRQDAEEKVNEYMSRLKALAASCGFCDEACLEQNILEQLVEGLRDKTVSQKLLAIPDLTVQVDDRHKHILLKIL